MKESNFDFEVWEWELRLYDEPPVPTPVAPHVDWLAVWSVTAAGVIVVSVCVGLFWFGGAM